MKRVGLIVVVIVIAGVGAYGYIAWRHESEWRRGKALAEYHWKSEQPVLFTRNDSSYTRCEKGVYIEDNYDRDTGLLVRHEFYDREAFYDGYNSAISQLLAANSVPPWSLRGHFPSDNELTFALTDTDMKKVTSFPAEITDNLVIVDGGTFSRWGRTSSGTMISIEARLGGTIAVGRKGDTVYVGRKKADPRVVLIRMANRWVGAFHEDGRYISSAFVSE